MEKLSLESLYCKVTEVTSPLDYYVPTNCMPLKCDPFTVLYSKLFSSMSSFKDLLIKEGKCVKA